MVSLTPSLLFRLQPEEVELEEAEPEEAPAGGAGTAEAERPWDAEQRGPAAPSSSRLSEVEIPSVGKIPVRSDADGYNEEVQSPAQGLISAGH